MKSKRKSSIVIAALALIALMLVSLTLAFLTDRRSILNQLGLGQSNNPGPNPEDYAVAITLTEPEFAKVATKTSKGYSYSNLKPGTGVVKDPTVTAAGYDDIYIRVSMVVTDGKGVQSFITEDTLNNNTLFQDLGVKVNDGWVNIGNYWYLVNEDGSAKVMNQKDSASVLALGDDNYTLRVPASYNNADLEAIGNILDMEIIGEAVQADGFAPNMENADPWNGEVVTPAF